MTETSLDDFLEPEISQEELEGVTVKELNALTEAIFAKRAEVDAMQREVDGHSKELSRMKAKAQAYLTKLNLPSYRVPGVGLLNVRKFFNVTVPRGDDKDAFFRYLTSTGELDALTTVNSQTLNSWYKEKLEQAAEEGIKLVIPGLKDPKLQESLSMRKA